ncbi:MAG TPA: hypothetical protein PLD59_12435 [Tepidisphaeraceae bacterium]|nr:hypothetical protein [Tepidisphaeraceae bacterium]
MTRDASSTASPGDNKSNIDERKKKTSYQVKPDGSGLGPKKAPSNDKVAKKLGKKTVEAVFAKVPIVLVATAAYDTYQGGVGHAFNEATWPLSELWGEETEP